MIHIFECKIAISKAIFLCIKKLQFYNTIYLRHNNDINKCRTSINNIKKARKRIKGVWKTFRLPIIKSEYKILDVGCGLGFISRVFYEAGAEVTIYVSVHSGDSISTTEVTLYVPSV